MSRGGVMPRGGVISLGFSVPVGLTPLDMCDAGRWGRADGVIDEAKVPAAAGTNGDGESDSGRVVGRFVPSPTGMSEAPATIFEICGALVVVYGEAAFGGVSSLCDTDAEDEIAYYQI